MKTFSFRQFKPVLVLALSILAVYLGWLNLADRKSWKRPVDGISWVQTAEGVKADLAGTLPEGSEIQEGDLLKSVNDIAIRNLDDYIEVIEVLAVSLPSGTPVHYRVEKAGTSEQVSYPVAIRLESQLSETDFLLIIVALIYLAIGLYIFLRNWKAQGAFHFFFLCLTAFVGLLYRHSGRADAFDLLIYWCSASALLLLPPLFLHFCCYFPEPLSVVRRTPGIRAFVYLPFAFLLTAHALWFAGGLEVVGLPRTPGAAYFLDRVHLAHLLSFFVLGIVALVTARRETQSLIQRRQMKWLIRGTLVGVLPFAIVYAIPYLLGLPIHSFMEASILSLALVPLSFGYAITKYRLMDVDVIFKQGVAYVLSSSALLGLYLGIVLLAGRLIQDASPESGFLFFGLSALMVAFLFAPLKNRIQEQIDRYFYKEQFDFRRSFADFGKTLSSEINLSMLIQKIATRSFKSLHVSSVAVFLRNDAQPQNYQLFHIPSADLESESTPYLEPQSIRVPENIFLDYDRQLRPLFLSPPSEEVEEFKRRFSDFGLHYLFPLRVHGRLIGFLGLSRRQDGDLLSTEDLDLISTLSDYAAIAIDNAILYESLESKAAELGQLKAYSDNVVQSIMVGVAVVNPQGQITVWNRAMADICELEREETVGKDIRSVLPLDLIRTLEEIIGSTHWTVSETKRLYKTHLRPLSGGGLRLVNITLLPFVLRGDIVTGTLLVMDDITEKVRLEDQLFQAEKLSSIGLFAAGVAHEVNTPLAGISSYVQMLLKKVEPQDEGHGVLKKIETQTFRASEIVNNLLNFARFNDSELQEINLNSLMTDTVSLLEHQLRNSRVQVLLELDPSLPKTFGNGGKLQQVFLNLFLNAKDAMPDGGKITIETKHDKSTLVIRIRDTGMGISKEHILKIYDPFFTTKEVGKGTGLGLSVSYGIIQEHSGRISVESTPGNGTTFTLHLPVKRIN
ncbi:MAG: ATP-binding protein [Acidobacteriota bacterium]